MIERFIKNDLTLKRYRRFKRRKLAVVSLLILALSTFLTLIAPLLANSKPLLLTINDKTYFPAMIDYHPTEFGINGLLVTNYRELAKKEGASVVWPPIEWDPFESNKKVDSYPAPPSTDNLMGTDDRGRDVLTRLLYGFKYSIAYAVFVWIITTFVGIILGGIIGFFGGKVDFYMQRAVEVMSTIPQFFILIILISMITPNVLWLIIISSIFGWIQISYYVRGEFLKNRKREFVEAARSLGASNASILLKHILPNSLTPIITFAPFTIAMYISSLAALDFLGFGLPVPTPSWGELLNQAQQNYTIAWWLATYPSLCLFFTLTLLNLIGEGVRDAMDPNLV